MVAVDLVLAVAAFVMAVLRAHAHLLHGQADVPAEVLACIQRGHVKVAAKVDGDTGGAAPVIILEQVELTLCAHIASDAQLFEFAIHAAQKAAAVAAKGLAVRLFHITEELHHPALGRPPGENGHGGKIRPQYKVAFLNVHKACNGAAVKADTILHGLGQVAGKHGDVFLGAKDIAEGKADKFDVVVLHKIKDVLLGIIAHSGSLRAAGCGEWHISAKLENQLHKRVIGQDEAVTAVAKAIKRGRVGLKDPKRPIGSFLLLGPTGVGKTELSKALAEAVFGSEDAMIRVDMSEYMEKHSVSKLIGSPPGYVGYEEGGQLSEKVRRSPYSVLLFDEIEKAHPDVFNLLLQVLDDGHITDAQGRKVDFKETIIIMTSNAGAQAIVEPKKLGFGTADDAQADYKKMKDSVMEEVKRLFKPEFLNRIDDIIVFHTLNKEEIKKIVGILLKEFAKRCKTQLNIDVKIRENVKEFIGKEGFDPKYGARPLKRAIQSKIEDAMAEEILEGRIKAGDSVTIGLSKVKGKILL